MSLKATHNDLILTFRLQIKEILFSLQYLHQNNVFHGSVQPTNILIQEHGHAVVSDLSLAKIMDPDIMNSRTYIQPNSLRYKPPEISENEPMTSAGDLYSWAMTALEILSGSESTSRHFETKLTLGPTVPPFHTCKTPGQLMKLMVVDKEVPQPFDHSCQAFLTYPRLWDLLQWCWMRDPKERPTLDVVIGHLTEMEAQESE